MTSAPRFRAALSLAAASLAAVLVSCAEAPKPPPPPPPTPSVSLSPKLIEQASAYRAYMNNASAISPAFADGPQVAQSLKVGAAYEPQQLLRGAIAYAAVVALQDPTFVAGVRAYAADPVQRQSIAYSILRDPAYVIGISGSNSAAGLVISALGSDGRKLYDAGKAVKQAAYDVQHSPWSKGEVANRDMRLNEAKTLSSTVVLGDVAETSRLQLASNGGAPLGLSGDPASPPYTPVVVRGLAVAALAALGQASDENLAQILPLMADPTSATCLKMSKLNLYQCLAVSKPYYEDVFCLGQHVMIDTGQCVIKGVGATLPMEVVTRPLDLKTTPVTPTSSTGKKPNPKKKR